MWTAIALICVAAIIAGAISDKGKKKNSAKIDKEIQALQDKMDALEADLHDRVTTLERIVTNPKDDLKRQFDDLG
jgi:Skp family chaperone for outer membrane proteins